MQFTCHTNQEVIYKKIQFIPFMHLIILDLKEGLQEWGREMEARTLNLTEDSKRKCI